MADEPTDGGQETQAREGRIIPPELIPKDGKQSSSYMVALVSALAPLGMLIVLVVGLLITKEPDVRAVLIDALKWLITAGILGGAAVGATYVSKGGARSVAKIEALARILTPDALGDGPVAGRGGIALNIETKKEGE